jgi:GPH family glycoside/pentoside/hexuronide:cation symporter
VADGAPGEPAPVTDVISRTPREAAVEVRRTAGGPPKGAKFFYGLGAIAFGVKDSGFSALLLLYYNQVLGLPSGLAGLALGIALFVDAFVDPIVGYASDNLHSRWGRRHPFMYAAAVPAAVSYALLWNPPHLSQNGLFFYLLFATIIIRAFITCYEIPSTALMPELTTDYDQRTAFVSLRVFLGGLGGLTVSMLALRVFLRPTAAQPVGQLNPGGYHIYGVVAGAIMFCAIMVSAIGTHGAIARLRQPPPKSRADPMRAIRVIWSTLSDRSVVVLLACGVLWAIAAGIVGSLGFYLNTYFWELSANQISFLVVGSFVAYVLALLAAPWSSKRFGKKATAVVGSIGYLALGPAPIWLRLAGVFPVPGSPWLLPMLILFLALQLAIGIVAAMIVGSMMADVVEAAEIRTGRRSEGLLASANAFIAKSTSGMGLLASGTLLALVGFPAKAQPHHVPWPILRNLALTYSLVVIGLYLVALALLSGYNINRAKHLANLARLNEARPGE